MRRLIVAYAREGHRAQIERETQGETRLSAAPLTAHGVQESLDMGKLIALLPVAGLVTSPALAPHQTGLVLQRVLRESGQNVPITTHNALVEFGYAVDRDSGRIAHQGERHNAFSKRIKGVVRTLRAEPPEGVVGVVASQRAIGTALEDATGQEHRVKPGTWTIVVYNAQPTLLALSAVSFSKADIEEVQRLLRPSPNA